MQFKKKNRVYACFAGIEGQMCKRNLRCEEGSSCLVLSDIVILFCVVCWNGFLDELQVLVNAGDCSLIFMKLIVNQCW